MRFSLDPSLFHLFLLLQLQKETLRRPEFISRDISAFTTSKRRRSDRLNLCRDIRSLVTATSQLQHQLQRAVCSLVEKEGQALSFKFSVVFKLQINALPIFLLV